MHDLVKDPRYTQAGGSEILKFLARHLIDYGSSKQLVRPIAAGTSAELEYFSMEEKSVASGDRPEQYYMQDPSEEAVRNALEKRG